MNVDIAKVGPALELICGTTPKLPSVKPSQTNSLDSPGSIQGIPDCVLRVHASSLTYLIQKALVKIK